MKRFVSICLSFLFVCTLAACSNTEREDGTLISDVIADPVFGDYGRLIFPVDTGYYSGEKHM